MNLLDRCWNDTYIVNPPPDPEATLARILIVEDSADNMRLFEAVLGLAGHSTVCLADGHGLVATLERESIDLVLMDIQLPACDGYTLLEEIRSTGHKTLPVVALTAHAMAGDEERAMEAGFDAYIPKPIAVREFAGQIAKILSRKAGTEIA
jgi:CheY-like chemotaxis protein